MKINDAIFGVFFLLLGAVILVHVQDFPKIPGQQVGPAIFPGLVAAGLAACGALLIVSGVRQRASSPWFTAAAWTGSGHHIAAFFAIVLGVVAYILFVERIGFLILAPVLLVVWQRALGVRSVPAVVVGIVATLIIWYAFYKLLRVPLPWGVLTPYAF